MGKSTEHVEGQPHSLLIISLATTELWGTCFHWSQVMKRRRIGGLEDSLSASDCASER